VPTQKDDLVRGRLLLCLFSISIVFISQIRENYWIIKGFDTRKINLEKLTERKKIMSIKISKQFKDYCDYCKKLDGTFDNSILFNYIDQIKMEQKRAALKKQKTNPQAVHP
jgi:hypothetical protein